jgi:lysophospholipid acyltransferase (LPLAT)-like uncharacterized protein
MPLSERMKVWLIALVGAFLLKSLHRSLRWKTLGKLGEANFWTTGGSRIFAFWHGRQLLMPFAKTDFDQQDPLYVLISQHRDGRLIAAVVERLGIGSVAGSSSRRSRQATRELIAHIDSGAHIAITPDGPKGPVYQSKSGVIFLASLSGRPIYPSCYSAERFWTFSSWDGMILPKPFSRAVRKVAEPIMVPANITKDQFAHYQTLLDNALNTLKDELDSYDYR